MAHHTYRTQGLVLGGMDTGEGSRFLTLFTEELGMVRAHCASGREMRSKMRSHTQPYTVAFFGLVRGKEVWRVANAIEVHGPAPFRENRHAHTALARVCTLLCRLVSGEERNERLYASLYAMFVRLITSPVSEREVRHIECITLLRTLACLGYLGESESFGSFIAEPVFNPELLASFVPYEREAVVAINRSLKATQM